MSYEMGDRGGIILDGGVGGTNTTFTNGRYRTVQIINDATFSTLTLDDPDGTAMSGTVDLATITLPAGLVINAANISAATITGGVAYFIV